MTVPGQIVILNGAPRSGKSTIASAAQASLSGLWVNLGVDASMRSIPERLRPGIGLRPGGERPDLEDTVLLLYAALYESIAAHARLGVNVLADVGHHEPYSKPLHILPGCAMRLSGFPVLWVGVRCPISVIWQRREQSWARASTRRRTTYGTPSNAGSAKSTRMVTTTSKLIPRSWGRTSAHGSSQRDSLRVRLGEPLPHEPYDALDGITAEGGASAGLFRTSTPANKPQASATRCS